jgi:acetolactate synthase-1/2/3 large subunit
MVRQWQQSFYGERYSHSNMEKGRPHFVNLAKSYGIKAVSITNKTEMEKSLLESKDYKGPLVFDFSVIEDENCYPMVAPGKSNSQMMGITKQVPKKVQQSVES